MAKIVVPKFEDFFREATALTEAVEAGGDQSSSEQLQRLKDVARLTPSNFDVILARYAQPERGDWRCHLVVTKGSALAVFTPPALIERTNMEKIEKGSGVLSRIRVVDFADKSLSRWKIVKTGRVLRTPIEPRPSLVGKDTVIAAIESLFGSAAPQEKAPQIAVESVQPIESGLNDQELFNHFKYAMAKAPKAKDFEMYLAYKPQQEGEGNFRCYFVAGDGTRLLMFSRTPVYLSKVVVEKIEREGFRGLNIVDVNDKTLRDKYGLRIRGRYDLVVGSKQPQEKSLPGSFKKEIHVVFPAPVEVAGTE